MDPGEKSALEAMGRNTALQEAQIRLLAQEVRRYVDAVGTSGTYPFLDSYMDGITEVAAHVLAHATHQHGRVNDLIAEVIANHGGDAAFGQEITNGTMTERQFLSEIGEAVVNHVPETITVQGKVVHPRPGVRRRYAESDQPVRRLRPRYFFHPTPATANTLRRRSRGLDTDWCAIRQSIIQTAIGEETFWTRGDGTPHEESDPDMLDQLRAYWRDGVRASDWSTKATRSAQDLESWSAAFVSWVMRTAGVPAGAGFTFSARHLVYIVDALRNREASDRNKPFWFYGIDEQDQAQPKPGDVICMNRGGSHFTYSSLRSAFLGNNAEPRGETHCNIVVDTRERDGRKFLVVIGGNRALENSPDPNHGVTVRSSDEIEVDDSGVILAPEDHRIFGIIALVGC